MAAEAPPCQIGQPAPDFCLPGVDGQTWTLADVRGRRGTLIMFLCNHCPYVKAVVERLVADVSALREHDIGAAAIMANDTEAYPEDGFDAMKRFAARHRFSFPYLIDESQEIARAYGAVCTPDFFGFDANLHLRYRGRLDGGRLEPPPPGTSRELHAAMITIAETGCAPAGQSPSLGCSIKWRK